MLEEFDENSVTVALQKETIKIPRNKIAKSKEFDSSLFGHKFKLYFANGARALLFTSRNESVAESFYKYKEGELVVGKIRKIDLKNVYVELGKGQVEGLMLPSDQVPGGSRSKELYRFFRREALLQWRLPLRPYCLRRRRLPGSA
mgnify:CR=1 FL=1